jgi:hypothetical protein
MKKTILSFLLIFLSIITFSQSKPYFKESLLYLTIENGVGVDVPVRFQFFSEQILNVIKQKDYYKNWLINYDKNTSVTLKEEWKDIDPMCIFLTEIIRNSSRQTKYQLKNMNSYNLIENSKGMILPSMNDNTIMFNFPFKGENGYGISKISDVMVTVTFSQNKVTYSPIIL